LGDFEKYKQYTGKSFAHVWINLSMFYDLKMQDKVRIRIPLIPLFADEKLQQSAKSRMEDMGFTDFDLFTYKIPKI